MYYNIWKSLWSYMKIQIHEAGKIGQKAPGIDKFSLETNT